jgi:hypothetical protein
MKSAFEQFVTDPPIILRSPKRVGKAFPRTSKVNEEARRLEVGQSMDLPKGTPRQTPGNMGRACNMQFRQELQPDGTLRIWRIR